MRRASQTKTSRTIGILAAGVIPLVMLLVWREHSHAQIQSRHVENQAVTATELAEVSTALASVQAEAAELNSLLEETAIERQSLQDRASNLEAQRQHLRTETDRISGQLRQAESTVATLRTQLEDSAHQLLLAEAAPRQLEIRLATRQEQIEQLEKQIDDQSTLLDHLPERLVLAGVSGDGSVFSVSGQLPDTLKLPASIYLCGAAGIALEGWLHRREEEVYIGHTDEWRVNTSTLVKGQKVFILPRHIYEADQ